MNLLTFDVVDGRIATCFVVRNPEKLTSGSGYPFSIVIDRVSVARRTYFWCSCGTFNNYQKSWTFGRSSRTLLRDRRTAQKGAGVLMGMGEQGNTHAEPEQKLRHQGIIGELSECGVLEWFRSQRGETAELAFRALVERRGRW